MTDHAMSSYPNLIYVFADQLRYQACGYTGNKKAKTPYIDQLAHEGADYCNAISGHPVCAPYRASLFTGKYSSSTGMVINELRMNPNHQCFGHILHQNKYETAYIGKWHLWANEFSNHHDPKNSYIPPGSYRLGLNGYWAAYNFHHRYFDTYYHTNSAERITIKDYEPDGQTDMAIDWLKQNRNPSKPFALFLSYGTPHDPWESNNVPNEFYEMFKNINFSKPPNYSPKNDPHADDWGRLKEQHREKLDEWKRIYYAMTANMDWNIGRLLKTVDEIGLRENTIFVFTSDHGEMFGAHGRRAKNIFYEEAIRIPFLIRWPGHIPEGHITDACLNTMDIMPSLLSMMNLPIPEDVEGMDLSHFALGEKGPEPEAAFLQGMGCTANWYNGYEWRALRSKQYTYAIYKSDHSELLFDNIADPFQTNNLVENPEHTDILNYFRKMLKIRMEDLNDTFELCTWYRDHWTQDRKIVKSATIKG
jgi:arylsulfatase A-like enzyme